MLPPGGVMDSSDFSPAWLEVFKKCGYSESDFKQLRWDVLMVKISIIEIYDDKLLTGKT